MEETKLIPIPEPRGLPLLGNILDVDSEAPEKSFQRLAETYGISQQARILLLWLP